MRFIEVESGIGEGLGSHHSWSAELDEPDFAYTRWLRARCGLPPPNSGVLEQGTSDKSHGRHLRKFDQVELVGLVPKLPDSLLEPSRWHTVIQRRWSHHEPIHMKEGRVALMSLRREVRRARNHGCRLLTLCDNLSAVCAFDKGRARDLGLLSLCRRSMALQLVSGIRWHLRYVETSRNPSDEGSRVFPSGTRAEQSPILSVKSHERGGRLNPLPCSSSTAQRVTPTATNGRGDRRPIGPSVGDRNRMPAEATEADVQRLISQDVGKSEGGSTSSQGHLTRALCSRSVLQTAPMRSAKTCSSCLAVAPTVLEVFSGSSHFTSAMSQLGLRVAVPFDVSNGDCFDATQKSMQQLIISWLVHKRIWYLHLGTPCTMFSAARTHPRISGPWTLPWNVCDSLPSSSTFVTVMVCSSRLKTLRPLRCFK